MSVWADRVVGWVGMKGPIRLSQDETLPPVEWVYCDDKTHAHSSQFQPRSARICNSFDLKILKSFFNIFDT